MQKTIINKNLIFLGIGILVGILLLGVLISRIGNSANLANKESNKVTIEDREKASTITFHRDGLVEYKDKTSEYSTVWSSEKMNTFFDYLTSGSFTLGEAYLITLPDGTVISGGENDELIDTVISDVTNYDDEGGGSGGGGGGSIADLFNTPNPSNLAGNTPAPTSATAVGGGIPSWCKHWRLSYCADNIFKTPTPTTLSSLGVILAKDCIEWKTQSSNKTVISGDSCAQYFPTPTPADN